MRQYVQLQHHLKYVYCKQTQNQFKLYEIKDNGNYLQRSAAIIRSVLPSQLVLISNKKVKHRN